MGNCTDASDPSEWAISKNPRPMSRGMCYGLRFRELSPKPAVILFVIRIV